MTNFLRLTRNFFTRNFDGKLIAQRESTNVKQLVRHFIDTADKIDSENLYNSDITSLPVHFQTYAYQTPDSILSSFISNSGNHHILASYLKALRVQVLLKNTELDYIKFDKRFMMLCNNFGKNCYKLRPALIVSGLRSLLEIGILPYTSLISDIDNVIIDKIEYFNITQLISCLHLHSKYVSHNIQQEILPKLIEALQARISEISTVPEVHMIIQMLHLFDKACLKEMQERLVEVISNMDTPDLIKVIHSISEGAIRNKVLLLAAASRLSKIQKRPSLKETASIMHDLNSLNFFDADLLLHLTSDRETEISSNQQSSTISALLTACGYLKWRHEGFLQACGQWLVDHSKDCTLRDLTSFILTAAAVNCTPKGSTLVQQISSYLSFRNIGNKDIWLDVAWSLAVLDHLNKDILIEVLSPQFHQSLLSNTDFKSASNNLKLMNLKYVLKECHPEYVFSCDLFLSSQEVSRSKESEACRNDVLKALNTIAPQKKYTEYNLATPMGVTIDAEFIINKKGKPLMLSTYGLKSKPSVVSKTLPKGAKRIALMVFQFRDYTLNDRRLTGVNALAVRLLSAEGYVVVQVPYNEFAKQPTEVKKVMYLSQLITDAKDKCEQDIK